jgi:alpha-galactosidase
MMLARGSVQSLLALMLLSRPVSSLDNGMSLTPPMGFDMGGGQYVGAAGENVSTLIYKWYCLSGTNAGINETQMMIAADFLHSSGMFAAGYNHVHSDDCWESGPGRVGTDNQHFGKGKFPNSTQNFPRGFRALGDYMHARKLQYGLCESAAATAMAGCCHRRARSL